MVHTSKEDERYFIETGFFPESLRANRGGGGGGGGMGGGGGAPARPNPAVGRIAQNVCREFVKRQCMRGSACKFYHPTPQELEVLLTQQARPEPKPKPPPTPAANAAAKEVENTALKSRVNQLERLLADACYCMTLAVGDQNPAISSLMKTISDMAPESALANQAGPSEGGNTVGNSEA